MRTSGILIILLTTLLTTLFLNCSEDPTQLNQNIFDPQSQGTIKDTTLIATVDTTFQVDTKINTQFSERLLLGQFNGFEARPMFRFTNFDSVPDSAQIQNARVRLRTEGLFGASSSQAFTVSAYPILNYWTTNFDTIEFDPNTPLSEVTAQPNPDENFFNLPLNTDGVEKVAFWADTANLDQNFGMILDFQSNTAQFMKSFSSIQGERDPELIVTYNLPGDTTTQQDTVSATFDGFIYEGDLSILPNPNFNFVSTLSVTNTFLQFDLERFIKSLPNGAIVNFANLKLPINLEQSALDNDFGITSLQILKPDSSFTTTKLVIDSASNVYVPLNRWAADSSFVQVETGEARSKLAQLYIQSQLRNSNLPYGFVIRFVDDAGTNRPTTHEKDFFSYLAFPDRKHSNVKPELILTYWVPPETRF